MRYIILIITLFVGCCQNNELSTKISTDTVVTKISSQPEHGQIRILCLANKRGDTLYRLQYWGHSDYNYNPDWCNMLNRNTVLQFKSVGGARNFLKEKHRQDSIARKKYDEELFREIGVVE